MSLRKMIYIVPTLTALGVGMLVYYGGGDQFPKFYEDKMRASLFTGFFTLSGFLLSAKSFIILNLKKEMFATPTYYAAVKDQMRLRPDGTTKIFQPLRNIGHVLLLNVALCLASSLLQFTVGLFPNRLTAAICLAAASAAAAMLVFSLVIIARNLHDMYDHFEVEGMRAIEKLNEESPSAI
jgi:hypothetical protein